MTQQIPGDITPKNRLLLAEPDRAANDFIDTHD
jgi:hypothetical protein